MIRFLVRTALGALAFYYLLPHIDGIQFHGGWTSAAGLAIFFSLMLWGVETVLFLLSALLTISTLGLALLVIVPLWLVGFWLIPAIALKLLADFMPNTLTVSGWLPATIGGLILLVISILTKAKKPLRAKN
jgi:uncharacterized membrane protein YvlD (DUF360 family)